MVGATTSPNFKTNKTLKLRYAQGLQRWITRISLIADDGSSTRGVLMGAGNLNYFALWHFTSRAFETGWNVRSNSTWWTYCQKWKKRMIERTTEIITNRNPSERKKLDLLSEIDECQRLVGEAPGDYIARFKGVVARYVNETKRMGSLFAVLAVSNAKVALYTLNYLMFQFKGSTTKQNSVWRQLFHNGRNWTSNFSVGDESWLQTLFSIIDVYC